MSDFLIRLVPLYTRSTLFALIVIILAIITPFAIKGIKKIEIEKLTKTKTIAIVIKITFFIILLILYTGILVIGDLYFSKNIYLTTTEVVMKDVTDISIDDDRIYFKYNGVNMNLDISCAEITTQIGNSDVIIATQTFLDLSYLSDWMLTPNLKKEASNIYYISSLTIYYSNTEK